MNEGIKSQKKGIIKPDKRALILADNLIGSKHIRVRPKNWRQSTHPRYSNFILYSGWKHWKKDYTWLYLPEEFMRVKEEILKELLEKKFNDKTGKEEFKHKRLAYYCSRNRNNQMTVNFQNLRRLDLLKSTTVLFFGGKEWDPEKDKENPDYGKRTWKEEPRLFFFLQQDYADNEKLLVEAKAEMDKIWSYTGNYYNSPGYGELSKSFIGHEHENHTLGINWDKDPNLKEGKTTFEAIIPECSACNDCFDFCGDLRVKNTVLGGFGRTMTSQWQPQYGILYSAPNVLKDIKYSSVEIETGTGQILKVPTNLQIRQWAGESIMGEKWFTTGLPCILYLVDKKHWEKARETSSTIFYPDYDQTFYHELPKIYNEQPHLMNHSTAQFYFQKKLLFTANIRHLAVGRKITPNSNGKPIFVIHYRINTASSVAGILYKFTSGNIFFRWELDTKASLANQTILSSLTQAFTGRLMSQVGEWGGKVVKDLAGAAAKWLGVGSLWKRFTGEKDGGKTKKGGLGTIKDILTPDKYKEQAGVAKTSGLNQDKKTEQHTERKSKSTKKGKEWEIESSVFATETIDFNYDFWEYSNRSEKNPFMPRFEHGEVFYNNLTNNSNLFSAPIRSLATPFSAFKQLLVPGFMQGEISLDEDDEGFLAGLIRRGIPFINKKEEFFKPFKYRYRGLSSYTPKSVSNAYLGQGEEIIEEVKSMVEEELGKFDGSKAIVGFTTYFRVPDDNLYTQMSIGKFSSHHTGPGNGGGNTKFSDGKNQVCWGCGLDRSQPHEIFIKAGGEIYTYFDSSDLGEGHIQVPNDCLLIVDAPAGNIRVKMENIDYIYHYKGERQEVERDEEIAEQDYQETDGDPTNTSAEVEIEIEDDEDKEEIEIEDDYEGKEEDQGEEDVEIDTDFDNDWDQDLDDDQDSDGDNDNDEDFDEDEDDDIDTDIDTDDDDDTDTDISDDEDDEQDNDDQDEDNEQDHDR